VTTKPKRGGRPNRGTGEGRQWGSANGKYEPFEQGNLAAVKHGTRSPRLVDGRAAELVTTATAAIPWLADASFERAVLGWARAEARCDLLAEYLDRAGLLDEEGQARPAADLAYKFERQAADARAKLGLDPTARARLEKDLADAGIGAARLEAAMAEGRKLRLAADDGEVIDWEADDG
jgi:hypothetical protein